MLRCNGFFIFIFLKYLTCTNNPEKKPFGKRTSGLSVILQTLHRPPKILGAELRDFVRINVPSAFNVGSQLLTRASMLY